MKNLKASLVTILDLINKLDPNVDFGGTLRVIDDQVEFKERLNDCGFEEQQATFYDYVIIDYDFHTDELSELFDRNDPITRAKHDFIFDKFQYLHSDQVYSTLDSLGYEEVETIDGSGNGLYYGAILAKRR